MGKYDDLNLDEVMKNKENDSYEVFLHKLLYASRNLERGNTDVINAFKAHISKLAQNLDKITDTEKTYSRELFFEIEEGYEPLSFFTYSLSSIFPDMAHYLEGYHDASSLNNLTTLTSVKQADAYQRLCILWVIYKETHVIPAKAKELFQELPHSDYGEGFHNAFHQKVEYRTENLLKNLNVPALTLAQCLQNIGLGYNCSKEIISRNFSSNILSTWGNSNGGNQNTHEIIQACLWSLTQVREQLANHEHGEVHSLESVECISNALKHLKPNARQQRIIVSELEGIKALMVSNYSEHWWLERDATKLLLSWKEIPKKDAKQLPPWDYFVWNIRQQKWTLEKLLHELQTVEILTEKNIQSFDFVYHKHEFALSKIPYYDDFEELITEILYDSHDLKALFINNEDTISSYITNLLKNLTSFYADIEDIETTTKYKALNVINQDFNIYLFRKGSVDYAFSYSPYNLYEACIQTLAAVNKFLEIEKSNYRYFEVYTDTSEVIKLILGRKKQVTRFIKKYHIPLSEI